MAAVRRHLGVREERDRGKERERERERERDIGRGRGRGKTKREYCECVHCIATSSFVMQPCLMVCAALAVSLCYGAKAVQLCILYGACGPGQPV